MDTKSVESDNEKDFSEVISLGVDDFQEICRICLGRENLSDITEVENKEGLSLYELFTELFSIDVKKDVEMPQKICIQCTYEVFNFYSLKQQLKRFEGIYHQLLNQDRGIKVEENDDNPKFEESEFANDPKFEIMVEEEEDHLDNDPDNDTELEEESDEDTKGVLKAQSELECHICLKQFDNIDDLTKHKNEEDHKPKVYLKACKVCGKMIHREKMKQHTRIHTGEKPYACGVCHQRFSLRGNLKRHEKIHTGEKPHTCAICGKGFIQGPSLNKHIETHTSGFIPHDCKICGRFFKRASALKIHEQKHIETEFKGLGKDDLLLEQEKPYKCHICLRGFKTQQLLNTHIAKHGDRKFLCSECGKGFFTKANMESHLKIHTGIKPYKCLYCGKSFAHQSGFETHQLIHSGLKQHKCLVCFKSFTQANHLKYHMRIHSGERPYACPHCGKTFAVKGNLTVHIRIHTGETPYLCNICGKGFYDSSSCKKHKRGHLTNAAKYEMEPLNKLKQQERNKENEEEVDFKPVKLMKLGEK